VVLELEEHVEGQRGARRVAERPVSKDARRLIQRS
jgi:hypothetical protein